METKYTLIVDERRDSVDSLDSNLPSSLWSSIRRIVSLVAMGFLFVMISWSMIDSYYQQTSLSRPKIEDQVHETATKMVREVEKTLEEVLSRADDLGSKNRKAAGKYVREIRDAMNEHTLWGVEKVNEIVANNVEAIKVELEALRTAMANVSNGSVDAVRREIDAIAASISSPNVHDLLNTLEDAIVSAERVVHTLWKDLDARYSYYATYYGHVIAERTENIADQMMRLLSAQRRFHDFAVRHRVTVCYDINAANGEITEIVKTVVRAEDRLRGAVDAICRLQSMYVDADEHAVTVVDESKALLAAHDVRLRRAMEKMWSDRSYFLGWTVLDTAEKAHPPVKRLLLRMWKRAIGKANKAFSSAAGDEPLIKDEYRVRVIDDVEDSLRKLGALIRAKAELVHSQTYRDEIEDWAGFDDLGTLVRNRWANVTDALNPSFFASLSSAAQVMKFNLRFVVDQNLPHLKTLSIQNYSPSDVCPVATDFADYLGGFVNDVALARKDGGDVLDRLLPSNGDNSHRAADERIDTEIRIDGEPSSTKTDFEIEIALSGDKLSQDTASQYANNVPAESPPMEGTELRLLPLAQVTVDDSSQEKSARDERARSNEISEAATFQNANVLAKSSVGLNGAGTKSDDSADSAVKIALSLFILGLAYLMLDFYYNNRRVKACSYSLTCNQLMNSNR